MANFDPFQSDHQKDIADINIIPLVDILLVLLVVFMVTAPISMSGVAVQLPKTGTTKGLKVDNKRIILSVDQNGQYFIGKNKVAAADLSTKLGAVFETQQEKKIYIRADRRVAYGKVSEAMAISRSVGVNRINMLNEAKLNTPKK